jgi:hypothetical protein
MTSAIQSPSRRSRRAAEVAIHAEFRSGSRNASLASTLLQWSSVKRVGSALSCALVSAANESTRIERCGSRSARTSAAEKIASTTRPSRPNGGSSGAAAPFDAEIADPARLRSYARSGRRSRHAAAASRVESAAAEPGSDSRVL